MRVHRGAYNNRARRRQKRGGHHIVGDAVGKFRDDVRRRGCHAHDVGLLRKRDVLDGRIVAVIERIGEHHILGKRLERERRHEFRRILGHDNLHVNAALAQIAYNLAHFVHRDATRNRDKRLFRHGTFLSATQIPQASIA